MKKWKDLFCTKKISKKGTMVADVHLYEPPQDTQTPCRICNEEDVEDVRDKIIGELSPNVEKANCLGNEEDDLLRCLPCGKKFKNKRTLLKHRKEFHPLIIPGSGEKSENKKVLCPQCHKLVSDIHLQKHLRVNCRQVNDNLSECTICKMMFPSSRLKEHVNGRVDKTGKVVRKGCAEKQEERKPEHKGEKVVCDQCGKTMNKTYLPTHKKMKHKGSSQFTKNNLVNECLAGDMAPRNEKTTNSSGESVVKGSGGARSNGNSHQQRHVFLTREAMQEAVLDCQFEMDTATASKKSIEENEKHLGSLEVIQRGARFLAAMAISVREPRGLIPPDGDCLHSCVARALDPNLGLGLGLDPNLGPGPGIVLHGAAMAIRISSVEFGLNRLDNISPENQERLARVCLEARQPMLTTEQMKARLAEYKTSGTYTGRMGDVMPYLAAAKYGTPILIIDIHDETHEELAHFVSPGDVFGAERVTDIPIVVVRHHDHFELLEPTEDGRQGLQFLYNNCGEQFIENQRREPVAKTGCKTTKTVTNDDKRGPNPDNGGDNNAGTQSGRPIASAQGLLSVDGGGENYKICYISSTVLH